MHSAENTGVIPRVIHVHAFACALIRQIAAALNHVNINDTNITNREKYYKLTLTKKYDH